MDLPAGSPAKGTPRPCGQSFTFQFFAVLVLFAANSSVESETIRTVWLKLAIPFPGVSFQNYLSVMIRVPFLIALLPAILAMCPALPGAARMETLGLRSRELLDASMKFSDPNWDEKVGLLWSVAPAPANTARKHAVRDTSWYAVGLLLRDQPGDRARATQALNAVMALQYNAAGRKWDGTFARSPEESPPTVSAREWEDYDPNWREFIGTAFALVLEEFADRLPAGMKEQLENSIKSAVESELTEGRFEPYHTNIKLLHGFLWSWAGARFGRPEWVTGGGQWAEKVAAEFAVNETFDEYNSPTYYGVDLYGLALWRKYGATEKIRVLGAQLEAGLWRDVGRFYHAGLKNLCGPFDRAYGMDMQRYVSLTGAWMGLALPAELTPLPDPSGPMDHAHDFVVMPLYVVLGAQVPGDVIKNFHTFTGERVLRRPITETRIATAWLSDRTMIGGEITGKTLGATAGSGQYHPATMHWQVPGGGIGWMRLYASPACDAEAGKQKLTIISAGAGDYVFRLSAPGLTAENLSRDRWMLPGLKVTIETDARGFTTEKGVGFIVVNYSGATRFEIRVEESRK